MKKRKSEIIIFLIILLLFIGFRSNRNKKAFSTLEMVEDIREQYLNKDDISIDNNSVCYIESTHSKLDYFKI